MPTENGRWRFLKEMIATVGEFPATANDDEPAS